MLTKAIKAAVIIILVIVGLAIAANSLTKPVGHDEHMYCTAGVLLAQGKMIYRDFSYVSQMPYHPLICAGLFKILNTTYYLLVGRAFSAICDILIAVCIFGIYRRVFDQFPISGWLLGIAAVILWVFNPIVNYANGFAWNHDAVLLCVVLSYWLFISTDFKDKSKYRRIAIIGVLLTLATCMRITTALVQLLFFVMLLSGTAESRKEKLKTVLWFLIPSAIVFLWPLWTIVAAPRAFFLNVFRIPILNSQLLHSIGLFHSKLKLIILFFSMPGCILLLLIIGYFCVVLIWQRHKLTISKKRNALLAVLLTITFVIIAFIPPTMWIQYLAMPVPFLIISFAYPLLYLKKLPVSFGLNKYFSISSVVITACVFITIFFHEIVLLRIPYLLRPQSWTPIRLHKVSEDIAQRTKSPKLVLTLGPLYALEGGCNIYTELSAGPFAYRIADHLSAHELKTAKIVGPKTLKKLLSTSPPSATVVDLEPRPIELKLLRVAKPYWPKQYYDKNIWERKVYNRRPVVYFRR